MQAYIGCSRVVPGYTHPGMPGWGLACQRAWVLFCRTGIKEVLEVGGTRLGRDYILRGLG